MRPRSGGVRGGAAPVGGEGGRVFKPITVSTTISSLTARFPGGLDNSTDRTLDFKGHGGHYQLTYDWRKYN